LGSKNNNAEFSPKSCGSEIKREKNQWSIISMTTDRNHSSHGARTVAIGPAPNSRNPRDAIEGTITNNMSYLSIQYIGKPSDYMRWDRKPEEMMNAFRKKYDNLATTGDSKLAVAYTMAAPAAVDSTGAKHRQISTGQLQIASSHLYNSFRGLVVRVCLVARLAIAF